MGRKRTVSREFLVNKVTFLAFNHETLEVEQKECTLTKQYDTNEELLKTLDKLFIGTTIKPVKILSSDCKKELRTVRERDYLRISVQADSETRKPLFRYPMFLVENEIEKLLANVIQRLVIKYDLQSKLNIQFTDEYITKLVNELYLVDINDTDDTDTDDTDDDTDDDTEN